MTKEQIHERITSIDRSPSITCPLSEGGYLEITIDPSSVPRAVAWILPESFYSGMWILGSAAIYDCNAPEENQVSGEIFYRFRTKMSWCSWVGGKVKEKVGSWQLENGQIAVQPEERVWIDEMVDALGKWLWARTEIIIHYRPSQIHGYDKMGRLRMRVSGAIVYDKDVPRDQFQRVVGIFKKNCFIKTLPSS